MAAHCKPASPSLPQRFRLEREPCLCYAPGVLQQYYVPLSSVVNLPETYMSPVAAMALPLPDLETQTDRFDRLWRLSWSCKVVVYEALGVEASKCWVLARRTSKKTRDSNDHNRLHSASLACLQAGL